MLHDAEIKLARLKALYEQWFQGMEKMEPSVPRKDLDRTFDVLKRNMPRNTGLRFRTQQLWARYGTYGIYWARIARQIEEGTYKRDILRVSKKRTAADRRKEAAAIELDIDVDVEEMEDELQGDKTDPGIAVNTGAAKANGASKPPLFDDADVDAILGTLASTPPGAADANKPKTSRSLSPFAMGGMRAAPAAASATFGKPKDKPPGVAAAPIARVAAAPVITPNPAEPSKAAIAAPWSAPKPMAPALAAPKPAPVASASNAAIDERQLRALYTRYVDARKQNNERTDVRYEALAESVQKMMPKLREKHGQKAIDFEVVVANGKVGLKPKVGP